MIVVQETTSELLSQEQLREVMQWVSPDDTDPAESYESAMSLRKHATGSWFLESESFKAFLEGPSGLFWLYGSREQAHLAWHSSVADLQK